MEQLSLSLNTGAEMPVIGLGTWKSKPDEAGKAVSFALSGAGYRHIDCAAIYRNEKEIGESFRAVFAGGAVKREEIFITSKLWNDSHAKADVLQACKQTLSDLNLEYLDLYLMHWGIAIPHGKSETSNAQGYLVTEPISIQETWEAMEQLVDADLVKAIGISNFTAPMITDLLSYARIPPAVNQIELHPYLQQSKLIEFCTFKNIVVTGYSPLGSPGNYSSTSHLLNEPTILEIASAHNKTPAQIALRWAVQRGTISIPKSTHPEWIRANINLFDFTLSEVEMHSVADLDRNMRFVDPYEWWKIPYFG